MHAASRQTCGAPRVHAQLRAEGVRHSRKRIERLMREAGLAGASRRRGGPATARRDAERRQAADLVHRHFKAGGSNRLRVSDITFVPTATGFLYLAIVLDAWSRRIVDRAMANRLRTELVLDALQMAIGQCRPKGVFLHSDQSSLCTSLAFGMRCKEAGVRPSMGSVGDAYDNAMAKSFFASLEAELLARRTFSSQAEALVGGGGGGARLERIAGLLDWAALKAVLGGMRSAQTGRPRYPPVVMLRVLLLAQWYRLSDPELEEALADRLSFRRFAGLPLHGPVPDETTICRFRGELVRHGLAEPLLVAVNAQLAAKGLVLRQGTLIDATLVEADADVRKGPGGRPVTVEREAGFARRRRKAFFGFKAHVAVDRGSGLVRRTRLTPANVNETLIGDSLVIGDEAAVHADKGYDSAARHAGLAERGIADGVMRRGRRSRPLTPAETASNRGLTPIRAAVERVFGTLKRSYRWARVRDRGLARNAAHLDLLALAMNLRRADVLNA